MEANFRTWGPLLTLPTPCLRHQRRGHFSPRTGGRPRFPFLLSSPLYAFPPSLYISTMSKYAGFAPRGYQELQVTRQDRQVCASLPHLTPFLMVYEYSRVTAWIYYSGGGSRITTTPTLPQARTVVHSPRKNGPYRTRQPLLILIHGHTAMLLSRCWRRSTTIHHRPLWRGPPRSPNTPGQRNPGAIPSAGW
jgi:hypothetical protein